MGIISVLIIGIIFGVNLLHLNLWIFSFIIGLFALQLYFGRLDIIVITFMYLCIISCISNITTIIHIPSSVNTESKLAYRLLASLIAKYCSPGSKSILSFCAKYKVNPILELFVSNFDFLLFYS